MRVCSRITRSVTVTSKLVLWENRFPSALKQLGFKFGPVSVMWRERIEAPIPGSRMGTLLDTKLCYTAAQVSARRWREPGAQIHQRETAGAPLSFSTVVRRETIYCSE